MLSIYTWYALYKMTRGCPEVHGISRLNNQQCKDMVQNTNHASIQLTMMNVMHAEHVGTGQSAVRPRNRIENITGHSIAEIHMKEGAIDPKFATTLRK